jgi:hypothetical protein
MSTALAGLRGFALPLRIRASAEGLRRGTLFLMVFGGSIAFMEPGPYEILGLVAIAAWAGGGLTLRREMIPIMMLVILYMTGSLISLLLVLDQPNTTMWTITGWYLAATSLFFMMVLSDRTQERVELIVRAYLATAVTCAAIGVLAYARLMPDSDAYLLYDRARATFKDPNVFGPFLVFPALVLIQRLYLNGMRGAFWTTVQLLIILSGLFLSFSRGAWGHFVGSVALMTVATLVWSRSHRLKLRIVVLCVVGIVALLVLLGVLLSFDSVSRIFSERASLEQDYDLGQFGRFNRHWLGFVLALSKPLGIGMLEFGPLFGEDTHNSYLNAFMSYGWIGGATWPALVALTLYVGWRHCLVPSPWRPLFICFVSTYSVLICEAWVIDIDHWRHAWLLFGVIWGLAVATKRLQETRDRVPIISTELNRLSFDSLNSDVKSASRS